MINTKLLKYSLIMTIVYTLLLFLGVGIMTRNDLEFSLPDLSQFFNGSTTGLSFSDQRLKEQDETKVLISDDTISTVEPNVRVTDLRESTLIDAPVISQLPELPRGCEVTSLAMLLNHAGVQVDKMTLAKEINKDSTPYKKEGGEIYFGNPNDGFVGNMYTYDQPGYGVYHEPIKQLAEKYLPGRIIDFSGGEFNEILDYLNKGIPVWVITNTVFAPLPKRYFQTWHTPSGIVETTFKEHSVLITGYDNKYIYFNDPLAYIKNRKVPKVDFKAAWIQMGRQAITYVSDD